MTKFKLTLAITGCLALSAGYANAILPESGEDAANQEGP